MLRAEAPAGTGAAALDGDEIYDVPDSPLKTIRFASLRSAYVAQVADDLGFAKPTPENTTQPIEQAMTEAFERVMADVNRQLFEEIS